MAENNEEQYLDELLNSLRSSNAEEGDEEQNSDSMSEPLADNAAADSMNSNTESVYDDIAPIIDESDNDEIAPIADESDNDGVAPITDDSANDEIAPIIEDDSQYEENNESDSAQAQQNDTSDDIFALEDNFDMGGEVSDEAGAHENAGNVQQNDDIPFALTEPEEADVEQSHEAAEDNNDDDSDDGLMQLLNQINGEDKDGNGKPDGSAGKEGNSTSGTASIDAKAAKEAEKERKKAEKLAKKEQRKKEKEEKKKNKKNKNQTPEGEAATEETEVNTASKENIDLINELYSDTDSLDNAPLGDDLADIPERDSEEEEPKKPKKEKKKKEPKPKKPKKQKVKKEKKAPKPSELVKVTPATFLGIIIFTAIVTVVVVFGTKLVNYSVSVNQAVKHFNNGKYDQAFDSISGLDIKDKDKDTYYKIRTVMSIYVDYTSYVGYKQVGMNVEALDSLINGIVHYDSYYSDAEKYDVVAQYDGVKGTIIDALAQYGVSEDDARYYAGLESEQQYEEILNNIGGRMQ